VGEDAARRMITEVRGQARVPEVVGLIDMCVGGDLRQIDGARHLQTCTVSRPAASARARYSALLTVDKSTSVALARNAPTVASFLAVYLNGSKSKKRQLFSKVILLISSGVALASSNSPHSSSGEFGHVESVCG